MTTTRLSAIINSSIVVGNDNGFHIVALMEAELLSRCSGITMGSTSTKIQSGLSTAKGASAVVLEVTSLGCVRGDRRLFRDVNFSLNPGSFLQIQGPNGSGKTSLLRMICGLLEPAEGQIKWQGANIRSLGEEYFAALTYIGHRNGVKDELTAAENLRVSSGLAGVDVTSQEALSILDKVGLKGRETLPARLLSQGQRRRLALARLVVCSTPLWVLDEVLTSLDTNAIALIKSIVEEHLENDGMAIIATHQELNLSAGSFQRLELAS